MSGHTEKHFLVALLDSCPFCTFLPLNAGRWGLGLRPRTWAEKREEKRTQPGTDARPALALQQATARKESFWGAAVTATEVWAHVVAKQISAMHVASTSLVTACLCVMECSTLRHKGVAATKLRVSLALVAHGFFAVSYAAHWASWCDTLPVIQARAPAAAARLHATLQGDGALPSAAAAIHTQTQLRHVGYEAPEWAALCSGAVAVPPAPDRTDDPWPFRGWQRVAARACDERAYETHLADLAPGQFASRALNVLPTRDDVAIPSAQFRVLLLRRLRLPLPLAPRRCSCHGVLDRSATTAPPVRRRACSPPVRCPWSMPSRASAAKLARGSPRAPRRHES